MDDQDRLDRIGLLPPPWIGEPHVVPEPVPRENLRDRYRGCLLGGAIGDTLGRPAEGRPRQVMRERWPDGMRDIQPWRGCRSGPVGTFTDDTQLTIVVADWLLEAGSESPSATALAEAIEEGGLTGRGIGAATRQSLALMRSGRPWWESGVSSAGNVAAMRAAPYGLRHGREPDGLRHVAALGSVPTHADVTAVASAVMQAAAVNLCLAAEPGNLDPDSFLPALVDSNDGLDLPRLAHRGTGERRSLAERITEVGELLDQSTEPCSTLRQRRLRPGDDSCRSAAAAPTR